MIKKVAALLLAVMLLAFAGCGAKPQAEAVAMGRYVQTNVLPKPVDAVMGLRHSADGTLAMMAGSQSSDGIEIEFFVRNRKGEWGYIPFPDAMALQAELFAIGTNDTMIAATDAGEVYRIQQDGTAQIMMPKRQDMDEQIDWLFETTDGRLITADARGGARVYTTGGQPYKAINLPQSNAWACDDQWLYAMTMQGEIVKYSLQTGNLEEQIEGLSDLAGLQSAVLSVDAQGALYLTDHKGIYRRVLGGSTWEMLLDASDYLLGDPSQQCAGMAADAGGTIHLLLVDSATHQPQLLAYHWDETLPTNQEDELTVWTLYPSDSLRQAASILQRRYPGTKVTVRTMIDPEQAYNIADVVKAVNTELLSGAGGDVLVLDHLNIQRYIDRGLLMDLSEWAQPYMDGEQWHKGIAATLADANGHIYAVPSRFEMQLLWGKAQEMSQFETYEQWIKWAMAQPTSRPAFAPVNDASAWFERLYSQCSALWADQATGKPNWDSTEFIRFLNDVKALGNGYPALKAEQVGNARGQEWASVKNDEAALFPDRLYSLFTANLGFSINRDRAQGTPAVMPFPSNAGNAFIPTMVMGINANTKQAELAKEYMDVLFSAEVQGVDFYDGLPVRTASLDSLLQTQLDAAKDHGPDKVVGQMGISNDGEMINMYTCAESTLRELRRYIDTLTVSAQPMDAQMMAYMQEALQPFFNGQKTAEQAAESLQQRLDAYLAE